ncbi:DNA protecting protein DprA [Luminiphilus syltensis NOR5-1B]|uniref:DNA protecting protein DprA n=1 Tax=Luminiphilus syltensis NOR5-1B TaxID=565045 RepID=B8KUG3_9GAMM|nr:DNA-processing protein DprA [Luminiphilus syltensis]EED36172.1 DNA protecting protein DprA [Luminiphilus syltensis NOR5-1B]
MPHTFGCDAIDDARWLRLLDPDLLSPLQRRVLFSASLTPAELLALPPGDWPGGLTALRSTILGAIERPVAAGLKCAAAPDAQVHLIALGDSLYPKLLRECSDAPPALFAVGRLAALGDPGVSIVGTRNASLHGLRTGTEFAAFMASRNIVVVSGLALGIDAAAHRGAIDNGGSTIAVLPTGVDRVYPARHRALAEAITEKGALISEFVPGTVPHPGNFPRRNRTISGLTPGTLVVEAGRPSGTLITATAAAQQGREVFAVPWSRYHRGGEGCLALLSDGATLAHSPAQVVHDLAPGYAGQQLLPGVEARAGDRSRCSADGEDPLLALIGDGCHIPQVLQRASGLRIHEFQRRITELEIAGLIERDTMGIRRGSP